MKRPDENEIFLGLMCLFAGTFMVLALYVCVYELSIEREKRAECKALHVPIYMCDGHRIELKEEQ